MHDWWSVGEGSLWIGGQWVKGHFWIGGQWEMDYLTMVIIERGGPLTLVVGERRTPFHWCAVGRIYLYWWSKG